MTSNFFHPSLLLLFLDPRSGIRYKHPGSATLPILFFTIVQGGCQQSRGRSGGRQDFSAGSAAAEND
jgi:hypothetical protein